MSEEKKEMTVVEKAAFIKGLAEGLELDTKTKEGKLISALIDLCGDLAAIQAETDDELEYLNDYIEEIDSDLGALEEEVYECDDESCCDDDDCDCCCDCCEDGYEVTSPSCGKTIVFDHLDDDEELVCPECGEKIVYVGEDK